MIKVKGGGVKSSEKPVIVLTEEEKEQQAYFKGYKSYLGEKLMEARDKEELLDILDWLSYKVRNNKNL